jgi:hypothetical protein
MAKELTQEALFESMSAQDFTRLFSYLTARDSCNLYAATRRAAAKLLCQLAHLNGRLQEKLCEMFKFTPAGGKVCLNKVPANVRRLVKCNPAALQDIKREEDPQCLYWSYPPFTASENTEGVEDFPDPVEHLIGFVVAVEVSPTASSYAKPRPRTSRSIQREGRTNTSVSPAPSRPTYSAKPKVKFVSPKPRQPKASVQSHKQPSPSPVLNRASNIGTKTMESIEHSIRRIRDSLANTTLKENSPMRVTAARTRLHQPSVSPIRK